MTFSFETTCRGARALLLGCAALSLSMLPVRGQLPQPEGGMAGFGSIALVRNSETRSISAENPKGERAGGAKAIPDAKNAGSDLGVGWKVRPCITLAKLSTVTLAEVDGPGIIQHIWITVDNKAYRDLVLRFYWDGEATPAIEAPLGDFFAVGHGVRYKINSSMIAVNPSGGMNSYWPMPFRKKARITVENQGPREVEGFFYQITYALEPVPDNAAYFHAQWRRSLTSRTHPEHVILDGVEGRGQYVGTFLAWEQLSNGWWGEGEVKFFMDGDKENPTICGTGTEDYFGGAWAFGDTYSTAYLGYPYHAQAAGEVPKHSLYRWHVLDPIRFSANLKVTIQALGWWPNGKFQPLTDDIASVAYWYQLGPTKPFPPLPDRAARFPR